MRAQCQTTIYNNSKTISQEPTHFPNDGIGGGGNHLKIEQTYSARFGGLTNTQTRMNRKTKRRKGQDFSNHFRAADAAPHILRLWCSLLALCEYIREFLFAVGRVPRGTPKIVREEIICGREQTQRREYIVLNEVGAQSLYAQLFYAHSLHQHASWIWAVCGVY